MDWRKLLRMNCYQVKLQGKIKRGFIEQSLNEAVHQDSWATIYLRVSVLQWELGHLLMSNIYIYIYLRVVNIIKQTFSLNYPLKAICYILQKNCWQKDQLCTSEAALFPRDSFPSCSVNSSDLLCVYIFCQSSYMTDQHEKFAQLTNDKR